MVRLGSLLKLSLNLAHARSQDGSVNVVAEKAIPQTRNEHDARSYALGAETARHAGSILQSRDTSVLVPAAELSGVLATIEDLERQVRALLQGGGDAAPHDDCGAENLPGDLEARAEDANGQEVSGRLPFRKNANCPVKSAVEEGEESGSGPAGSGAGGLSPETPRPAAIWSPTNVSSSTGVSTNMTSSRSGIANSSSSSGTAVTTLVTRTRTRPSTVLAPPYPPVLTPGAKTMSGGGAATQDASLASALVPSLGTPGRYTNSSSTSAATAMEKLVLVGAADAQPKSGNASSGTSYDPPAARSRNPPRTMFKIINVVPIPLGTPRG